jgi:hypothetical protein
VLLCVNSAWGNLNQTGFDILSNIASEVQLEEPGEDAVTDLMIKSLSRCIGDQDRFQVYIGKIQRCYFQQCFGSGFYQVSGQKRPTKIEEKFEEISCFEVLLDVLF